MAQQEYRGDDSSGEWNEYRRLVVRSLQDLRIDMDALGDKIDRMQVAGDSWARAEMGKREDDLSDMRVQIAVLQTKVAMIGVGAGSVAGLIVSVVGHFLKL